ncbi:MAG: methyl-accepting chemotaxis protein [Desulfobacteraceae bacterium]|nr:MAG: methyl-accepting chemotaxis protein [Desulfobacteraceae bacterium]
MFANMKLGTKIVAGFIVVSVIALALGITGYYMAVIGERQINEIGAVRLPIVDSLLLISKSAEAVRGGIRSLGIPGMSAEMRQRQYDNMVSARQAYEAAWKIYELLPQTTEEEKVWRQFVPAWEAWRTENNKFIELAGKFDQNGVGDPAEMSRQIERFTKDHYIVVSHVNDLMSQGARFEGGEDHTACNAGRWLPNFKTDNQEFLVLLRAFEAPHQRFHQAVSAIKRAVTSGKTEEARALYQREMIPNMEAVFGTFDKMLAVANTSLNLMNQAQEQMLGPVVQTQRTAMGFLEQLVQINRDVAAAEVARGQSDAAFFKMFSLIAMIVGVLLSLVLAFFITRSITAPIRRITDGLNEGAEQVSSASGQISSASQSLAEGASEQAASIEETSSSLEEMSSMTRQNAENAGQADTLMKEANQVVKQANDSMNQVTASMQEITKASEETSKIIKTIDEIAFQTNLLALNAAVEAARAGEAGAGFAVVADEVRNLAMRAAEAAKNTANLIEGTVKKVKDGSELVTKTNDAFAQVAESSKKVGELVGEISAASNEQAQGIEQVNKAVTEMDKVVQQNAANAEEAASASEEMNAQANQMKAIVEELMAMVGGGNSRKADMALSGHSRKTVFHHQIAHPKAHNSLVGRGKNKSVMADLHKEKKPEKRISIENDFSDF